MNRIFISYRSSDGKKEADRLCADLSRLYGADQVFFDKQDLKGGASWRSAIEAALGTKPVMLLLMTPDLFGVEHSDGGRRIDRDDDPIRGELLAAQANGATIVPLLTEGMLMPASASLPPPLRFLTESHALKLRTEDWATDLDKLVTDLRAHGIVPLAGPGPEPVPPRKRWPKVVAIAVASVFALLVLGEMLSEPADEELDLEADAAAPAN